MSMSVAPPAASMPAGIGGAGPVRPKVDVFAYSNYAVTEAESCRKHADQSPAAKLFRMKQRFDNFGLIRSVEAVCLVHAHDHPHVLLLESLVGATSVFRLPGGKCTSDEDEVACLHRKLNKKLFHDLAPGGGGAAGGAGGGASVAPVGEGGTQPYRVGDLLCTWTRPNFDPLMYPYRPPHVQKVKEVRSIYLVHLEREAGLQVPKDYRLVAVPLFDLFDNAAKYGNVIAGVPHVVSRLHVNLC